jgi:hypothetical protein
MFKHYIDYSLEIRQRSPAISALLILIHCSHPQNMVNPTAPPSIKPTISQHLRESRNW